MFFGGIWGGLSESIAAWFHFLDGKSVLPLSTSIIWHHQDTMKQEPDWAHPRQPLRELSILRSITRTTIQELKDQPLLVIRNEKKNAFRELLQMGSSSSCPGCSRQSFPGWSGGGTRGSARRLCPGKARKRRGSWDGTGLPGRVSPSHGSGHALRGAGVCGDPRGLGGRAAECIHFSMQRKYLQVPRLFFVFSSLLVLFFFSFLTPGKSRSN